MFLIHRTVTRLIAFALLLSAIDSPRASATRSDTIAVVPISRMAEPWWKQRFEDKQFELRQHPVGLLWLGDSITQNWERNGPETWRDYQPIWRRFYGDRHAINLGFKGDSTCHLLWRIEHGELQDITPRGIVLLIGANNFGHIHTDADATYRGIDTIIRQIHDRLPSTRIVLIGVLPAIRSAWVAENTANLDDHLRRTITAGRPYVTYVDASDLFLSAGQVDPAKFIDPRLRPPDPPLHPTAQVEEQLAERIEPLVASIMGDHIHH